MIVDSSTDRSAEIAEAHGARVLRIAQARPRARLHRRHRRSCAASGSSWATATSRTTSARSGPSSTSSPRAYEFVMGSRFRGYIEPGAMPRLHQFFGTPAHHLDPQPDVRLALQRHPLRHARDDRRRAAAHRPPEPVVGVRLRDGRQGGQAAPAHHRGAGAVLQGPRGPREPPQARRLVVPLGGGLAQPQRDVPLRARLLPRCAGPRCCWSSGSCCRSALVGGPIEIGGVGLDLHWMLLGVALTLLGYSALQLGVLARVHYDFDPASADRALRRVHHRPRQPRRRGARAGRPGARRDPARGLDQPRLPPDRALLLRRPRPAADRARLPDLHLHAPAPDAGPPAGRERPDPSRARAWCRGQPRSASGA